mgnify:CR=1 FL=1
MCSRTAFRPGAVIHTVNGNYSHHKSGELRLRARKVFRRHKKAPAFLLGARSFNRENYAPVRIR